MRAGGVAFVFGTRPELVKVAPLMWQLGDGVHSIHTGQHSLERFCLSVLLAFAGYFVLAESNGSIFLHFLVAVAGVLIMSGVAWLTSWHKHPPKNRRK